MSKLCEYSLTGFFSKFQQSVGPVSIQCGYAFLRKSQDKKQIMRHIKSILVYIMVKVKITLEWATKAQKVSRGIALLFPQPRRYMWGGWSKPRPGRFTTGKDPVLIV
jgi:hypothetical protein